MSPHPGNGPQYCYRCYEERGLGAGESSPLAQQCAEGGTYFGECDGCGVGEFDYFGKRIG